MKYSSYNYGIFGVNNKHIDYKESLDRYTAEKKVNNFFFQLSNILQVSFKNLPVKSDLLPCKAIHSLDMTFLDLD